MRERHWIKRYNKSLIDIVTVRRYNRGIKIKSSEIVVGDLLLVESGDIVAADGIIVDY